LFPQKYYLITLHSFNPHLFLKKKKEKKKRNDNLNTVQEALALRTEVCSRLNEGCLLQLGK